MEREMLYAGKLSRMIQANTVGVLFETDLARFYQFHELLRELFPGVFSVCETEDFNGSLLLRWKGKSAEKPILLMHHHDVVEADGPWKHDPFSGEICDGKIWGRGTVDTKSGLFCMLQAAEELIAEGFVPAQDIYFESACTEETDMLGAKIIAEELERRGIHFAYSLDEGGVILYDPIGGADGTFAMVAVGEKGCADLRFRARSEGGHSSMPGKNTPLVRLGAFMLAVERTHGFRAECPDAMKEMLLRIGKKMHGPAKLLLHNPYRCGKLLAKLLPRFSATAGSMVKTTIAFTMAQGAGQSNVLPQEAWVVGNMRFSHHQGREGSFEVVRRIAERYGVEMEILEPGVVSRISDFRGPAFRTIERAVSEVFPGVETAPYVSASASDNHFMTRVADCCFGFAPLRLSDEQLSSIHGLNENLDIAALPPAVDFYRYLMREGTDHA